MWSHRVVVPPPLFDDDLRFFEAVEDFPIQKFILEAAIEGLAIAVLPRRTGFNVSCFGTNSCNPIPCLPVINRLAGESGNPESL